MKKNHLFFIAFYILCLFPMPGFAGQIDNISWSNSVLSIRHKDCRLAEIVEGKRILILKLMHCFSSAGKINIPHSDVKNVKRIHWAQHDAKKQTVWVVITFSKSYLFDTTSSLYEYRVCIPFCYKPIRQKDRNFITEKKAKKSANINKLMFSFKGIYFQIPLQGMLINDFLDSSIGYVPKDFIRDGLPHFGAKRDDWKRRRRKHRGYDIYANHINVIAAAAGTVIKVRKNSSAGLYVKLHHGNRVYTLYVHLTSTPVRIGQRVRRGDIIGRIDGASGNAIEPQLHFEIKPNNRSINPLPLIKNFYRDDRQIISKIKRYEKSLKKSIQKRNRAVRRFLRSR